MCRYNSFINNEFTYYWCLTCFNSLGITIFQVQFKRRYTLSLKHTEFSWKPHLRWWQFYPLITNHAVIDILRSLTYVHRNKCNICFSFVLVLCTQLSTLCISELTTHISFSFPQFITRRYLPWNDSVLWGKCTSV